MTAAVAVPPAPKGSARRIIGHYLDAQVDPASLAAFRILFGLLLAASMVRFMALGWVDEFYVVPSFHFTWALAPWAAPLPPALMHGLFVALAILTCAMAAGFCYRLSTLLFFLGFSYIELIDKTTYLNHYYLVSLLTGVLVVIPAHRVWSVDAWLRRSKRTEPMTVPAWTVNLLRFQLGVVYLYAGLAKINRDWLFEAQPLRMWLAARSDVPVVGPWLSSAGVAFGFSWIGAAYDLAIIFLLLRARTRPLAYASVVAFHVMTAWLFPIGMFPWIMMVATLMFFPPDWPRRWMPARVPAAAPSGAGAIVPAVSSWGVALLAIYVGVQIALPLRAYWPGLDPDWSTRGFNFAWRVMLVEKSGFTELTAVDPATGRRWTIDLRDFITERQEKMMVQDPYMIRALARHVATTLEAREGRTVEIHADSFASINGRPAERLIDPGVNLAGAVPARWIVPRGAASARYILAACCPG